MNHRQRIRDYIEHECKILKTLDVDAINTVLNILIKAHNNENDIYIFGNGGSAATASHFVNDFNKGISEHTKKKFRFQCLSDNIATIMAIANDISYDEIFVFQLRGRLKAGDMIIAISGSGNSPNVINAVEYAKTQGNTIIGLTGFDGGKLRELADVSLHVPVNSMQVTEDIHLVFDHLMMSVLYEVLCGKEHLP